jgi:hypothetical protein
MKIRGEKTVLPNGFGHDYVGKEKQINGCDCFSEPISDGKN